MPDEQPFPPIALTVENLAASRGGTAVLAGVQFALAGGEALAVTGPNGVGKSTLLRLLAGLLRPTEGKVVLAPELEAVERVHYLGHLDALKAPLSIAQNLMFWSRQWRGDVLAVEAALDRVGLGPLADLPVAVLSAGQRRRAAMARLLLARRPLWLLDEPTASLDSAGIATLGALIEAHLQAGGMAVIATHSELPVTTSQVLRLEAA